MLVHGLFLVVLEDMDSEAHCYFEAIYYTSMHFKSFRRGHLSRRGQEIEDAVTSVDPYLYVDTSFKKPGQEQLWRKHPESHLPMPIFDIPSHASISAVIRKLKESDMSSHDLFAQGYNRYEKARSDFQKTQRNNNRARALELADFIRKYT